jgi:hypothetical protein
MRSGLSGFEVAVIAMARAVIAVVWAGARLAWAVTGQRVGSRGFAAPQR